MTLKSTWRLKDLALSQAKATLKNCNIEEHRFPHFKTFCEATVAKIVQQTHQQIDNSVGQVDRHMKRNIVPIYYRKPKIYIHTPPKTVYKYLYHNS